jgi:hypothetical protein
MDAGFPYPSTEQAYNWALAAFHYSRRPATHSGLERPALDPIDIVAGLGIIHRLMFVRGVQQQAAARVAPQVQAPVASGSVPRIYSARELLRRAQEPGPFHNFPESFNQIIFRGNRQVISERYVLYTQRGAINGRTGTFEIGVRPSASGGCETIVHRFFRPD